MGFDYFNMIWKDVWESNKELVSILFVLDFMLFKILFQLHYAVTIPGCHKQYLPILSKY